MQNGLNIMDDVGSREKYQETGQEKRPARMVGLRSLESTFFGRDAQSPISCISNDGRGY